MILGSHVGMSGKEMMLASAKEAASYGANTFMAYTGAPQNTRRKEISELNIDKAWEYMGEHGIDNIVIHAPYIINLANTVKPETFQLAVEFLAVEIERTAAMRSNILVLHPGSHVGQGVEAAISIITDAINEAMFPEMTTTILLETMAGKGTEIGRNFEELKSIIDGVKDKSHIGVCLDTCHVWDGGYDIVNDFDKVLDEFDQVIGLEYLKAIHINDSMNPCGAHKDRHEKIGEGHIGNDAFRKIVNNPRVQGLPFILETPNDDVGYAKEIEMIKSWQK